MLRNKLGYLLFLIITGLYAILYNVYFTGIIFLVAVFLPLVLMVLLIITYTKVTVKLDTATPVAGKGEYLNLSVNLNNASIFPISRLNVFLCYYNDFSGIIQKEKILVSMDRNSTQNVTCQISSTYCGNLIFKLNSICIYDYFFLFSLRKKLNKSLKIAVVPEFYELSDDIIVDNNQVVIDSEIYSEYKSGDDPSEVFGIREYREGDKPHHIHWKLSYKQDQLMIKEFSEPKNCSIVVLLELYCGVIGKKKLEYVDGLLECAMSLSYSCILKEHFHNMIWYEGTDCTQYQIAEQQDTYGAMEALLQTKLSPIYNSIISAHNTKYSKERYTHMIYITSILTEEDIYNWTNTRNGTLFYLVYVNHLEVKPVKEVYKRLLQDMQVVLYEVDLKCVKESILAIGL